jgi:hypothetical protein
VDSARIVDNVDEGGAAELAPRNDRAGPDRCSLRRRVRELWSNEILSGE